MTAPPPMGGLSRYIAYSASAHVFLLMLLFISAAARPKRAYYGIQFVGGQSGLGAGRMEPAPPPSPSRAPAREAAPASTSKETPAARSNKNKIAVKKADPKAKKTAAGKTAPVKETPSSARPDPKGVPGGRGESPEGRGDTRGAAEGPVGGVGNSLEIGGFGPGGGAVDSARFPYAWYVNILYQKLYRNWELRDPGTLECVVAFTIERDGTLKKLKVVESSGDSVYDSIAKRAVEVSAPFTPLPPQYAEDDLPVLVRFKLQ